MKLNKIRLGVFTYQENKELAVSSCSLTINTKKGEVYYEKERLTVLNFLAMQYGT